MKWRSKTFFYDVYQYSSHEELPDGANNSQ